MTDVQLAAEFVPCQSTYRSYRLSPLSEVPHSKRVCDGKGKVW